MEIQRHGPTLENQQLQNDAKEEESQLQLHQKQSQDDVRQGQTEQSSLQTPRTTGVQISERNTVPISEPDKIQNLDAESQFMKGQKMGSQQAMAMEQHGNLKNQGKQIPFMLLLPALKPHLDKDREMQLQTLFDKLKKNEIAREQFVRLMRSIIGDQVIRLAVATLQSQPGFNQSQLQSQPFAHQHNVKMPASASAASAVQVQSDSNFLSAENNAQKSQEVERKLDSHGVQVGQLSSSGSSLVNQDREHSSNTMPGHNKQQQHMHFPQTSFSMYGSNIGTYHPYSGTNVNTSGSSMKPQPHDVQMRQMSHQAMGATQIGGSSKSMNLMGVPKFERQGAVTDPTRVQSGSISQYSNKPALQQNSVPWQTPINKEPSSAPFSSMSYVKQEQVEQPSEQQQKPQLSNPQSLSTASSEQGNTMPGNSKDESVEKQSSKIGVPASNAMMPSNSVSPSIATQLDPNVQVGPRISFVAASAGFSARTPPKKTYIGQKKPLEALGSSPPASSKKQKVSGTFLDQSIEHLNDVTAVSGVNLREEEEQLFSGSKEDSQVSEASRRVVQEEEERMILQKTPLQKKLAEIMAKCGLMNINTDVERCLSLCVEERLCGLISNLIRLSKQRVDAEKPRHWTVVTSDVGQQIMTMNRKAREEWEKKQAEEEKLRKANEPDGDNGVEGDKEKDESHLKSMKVNKEEDDKMRTTAANVAARAAVGGDDMLSKWQLMAENRKKQGGNDAPSGSSSGKDVSRKSASASRRNTKDNQDTERRSPTAASRTMRKFGRNQVTMPQIRVARTISVKDVIAALEREPQMSKSTLIYQLYERIQSDAAAE